MAVALILALFHVAMAQDAPASAPSTRPAGEAGKKRALFVGSSSIQLWKGLPETFPEVVVLERGTGGKTLSQIRDEIGAIVVADKPDIVVLYAGSHDLHRDKKTPQQTRDDFVKLCQSIRAALPATRVLFISCKPSLEKWERIHLDRQLNELIAEWSRTTDYVGYVDIWTPMCAEGTPPPERLFQKDRNHVSEEGYAIWAQALRPYLRGEK